MSGQYACAWISWRAHAASNYRTKRDGTYVRCESGLIYAILGIFSASAKIGSIHVAEKQRVAAVTQRAANKVSHCLAWRQYIVIVDQVNYQRAVEARNPINSFGFTV